MDKQFDPEAFRETLRVMPRAEFVEVCKLAGVSHSTVDKFRGGHTGEIGSMKTAALLRVISNRKPSRKKQEAGHV